MTTTLDAIYERPQGHDLIGSGAIAFFELEDGVAVVALDPAADPPGLRNFRDLSSLENDHNVLIAAAVWHQVGVIVGGDVQGYEGNVG